MANPASIKIPRYEVQVGKTHHGMVRWEVHSTHRNKPDTIEAVKQMRMYHKHVRALRWTCEPVEV